MTPIEQARYAVVKNLADERGATYLIPGYLRGEMDDSIAVQTALAHLHTDLSVGRAREVLRSVAGPSEGLCNVSDAIRAMHQYAAGLQGEVEALRAEVAALRTQRNEVVEACRQRAIVLFQAYARGVRSSQDDETSLIRDVETFISEIDDAFANLKSAQR